MVIQSVLLAGLLAHPAVASPKAVPGDPSFHNPALAVVVRLYHDYAWEAVIDEPPASAADDLLDSSAAMARYFSPGLIKLIERNKSCEKRNGVCNLDMDPIWDSQDPTGASGIKIEVGSTPDSVKVSFKYPSETRRTELTYLMVKVGSDWRISDIVYPVQGSLTDMLSRPPSH